jgi:TonB-dependent SusC/RagA subfamily outer membrane receptor
MTPFIEYLLKLSICLAIVYLFYRIFLDRLTFYRWNRWYLFGYSILSFFIPLVNIMPGLKRNQWDHYSVVAMIPSIGAKPAAAESGLSDMISGWDWWMVVFAAGTVILMIRFLIKMLAFRSMKQRATLISQGKARIYVISDVVSPFSFGNAIFLNRDQHNGAGLEEIIRHEFVHVRQKHSIDIIWCELLCMVNWFNPFAWMLRRSVKQNLEFIADQEVVQHGCDPKEYQYLLLKVTGNPDFAFATPFNFSSLRRRIIMLNSLRSARIHLFKFLFILPVVAVILLSFRKESHTKLTEGRVPFLLGVTDTVKPVVSPDGLQDLQKAASGKPPGSPSGLKFTHEKGEPLILVNGSELPRGITIRDISPDDIYSVDVLKNEKATGTYGPKGKNGVIKITLKPGVSLKSHQKVNIMRDSSVPSTPALMIRSSGDTSPHSKGIQSLPAASGAVSGIRISGDTVGGDADSSGLAFRKAVTPLFVLDGSIVSREKINSLSPGTIERVSVLKGASATSVYGEKGRDGVVEVKTKNLLLHLEPSPEEKE